MDPTIRKARYLFHFKSIVEDLKKESEKLRLKQHKVQHDVSIAEQNAESIYEDVRKWQLEVEDVMKEVQNQEEKIQVNKRCLCGCCPNIIWRCNLGKDAMKKTTTIRKLQEDGNFDRVSDLTRLEYIPSQQFIPFESTKSAFNQIMAALEAEDCNMIGLYGTGGVGKTTLAKEVFERAKELKLFDIAMAVVSQNPNFTKIQDQIAEWLGLEFTETTEEERASELITKLMNTKKILIILDDVWENLNLAKDIGIPYGDGHYGCKILLITRDIQVCNDMGSKKNILVNALSEKEAWVLFKKHSGLDDNSPTLNDVAMKVVGECKGLPLAIVTVGSALNGKTLDEYKLAFENLKQSKPVGMEDIAKEVYASIQLSYDYLKTKETKLCFLLCSLFSKDYELNIEDLVWNGMGLDLFQGIDSIETARRRLHVIINDLKASSLLSESSKQEFVTMHDLVRNVTFWIASKRDNVFMVRAGVKEWPEEGRFEQYIAISMMANKKKVLPSKVESTWLKILLWGEEDSMTVRNSFLEEIEALKVLTLSHGFMFPQSLEFLTNLQMLRLEYCNFNDISSLGKLKRLEVLSFCGSLMEALPNEVGELNNLRLLDLTKCEGLKRIPPDVIGRLSKLEELYIGGKSFTRWEIKGKNASMSELNSLSYLAVLSITLNLKSLPHDFSFHSLLRYDICLTDSSNHNFSNDIYDPRLAVHATRAVDYPQSRKLSFRKINASSEVNAFKELLQTVKLLALKGTYGHQNIIPTMEQGGFNALISLGLESCNEMECLIDSTQQQVPTNAFSNLEKLSLLGMNHLSQICYGDRPPTGFLRKLKTLTVLSCNHMASIFPEKLLHELQNLEEVTVSTCDELLEVFEFEGPTHHVVEGNHVMLLSNLTTLYATLLHKLRWIWKGPTQHVSLQSLRYVTLSFCGNLTCLFSSSLTRSLMQLQRLKIESCDELEQLISIDKEDGEILTKAHIQPLCFSKLTTLKINYCRKLEYIFSISIARGLRQLENLKIRDCQQLKKVFTRGKAEDVFVGDGNHIMLPKLRKIKLWRLKSLTSFYEGNFHWMWPSLQELRVVKCPKLTNSFITNLKVNFSSLQKQLRVLHIGNCSQLLKTVILILRGGLQNLKILTIGSCEGVQEVFQSISSNLEELILIDLPELKVIWKGSAQIPSFKTLTKIHVKNCNKLTHIFSPSLARNLPRLESLDVQDCEELERIIGDEDKDEEDQVMSLKGHVQQPICFPSLKKIEVSDCNKLKSLLSITIARGLPQLEKLSVKSASELEEVFSYENEEHIRDENKIVLHQLSWLCLEELPKLISFCPGSYHFVFPSLDASYDLKVTECPNITTSFSTASDDGHVHANAIPETPQLVKEDLPGEPSTTYKASHSNIMGEKWPNTFPPYMEESS